MASRPSKGRSLTDFANEKIAEGVLDAEEMKGPARWQQKQTRHGAQTRRYEQPFANKQQGHNRDEETFGVDVGFGGADASNLNWQQQQMLGSGGGARREYASRPQQKQYAPRRSNQPEWATGDLGASAPVLNEGELNWQQRKLMSRDDNDPFLGLVRGEHEYARE